jgi:hypothetical protein
MLERGEVQRVPASRDAADRLIHQARTHLSSAKAVRDADPDGAYVLTYDAARKALAAILENQGLRASSRGGHVALLEAVQAQLDPPLGRTLRPFNRMRRKRNLVEYAPADTPDLTPADVEEDSAHALELIELAERVLNNMSPF